MFVREFDPEHGPGENGDNGTFSFDCLFGHRIEQKKFEVARRQLWLSTGDEGIETRQRFAGGVHKEAEPRKEAPPF